VGIRNRQKNFCRRCGGKGKVHDSLGIIQICLKCKGTGIKIKEVKNEKRVVKKD
jgi:DnaJ-class molecular chaperone